MSADRRPGGRNNLRCLKPKIALLKGAAQADHMVV
jgi:hypothetical protein